MKIENEEMTFCEANLSESIKFFVNGNTEMLRLDPNGDIYIKGRLAENDLEVVNGMRDFLAATMKR